MSELVTDISGSGPVVVLLHGQPGGREEWGPVTALLEDDFRVVAPDRPGYGNSGGRARGFRGNAAAVLSLLDRLEVPQAIMVGFSWGGGVALALAEDAPSRVAGLVLVSSVTPGEPLGHVDRLLAVPPIGTAVTAGGLFVANGLLALPPLRRALERRPGRDGATASAGYPGTAIPLWLTNRVWRSFVTEQRCLIDELPSLAPRLGTIDVPAVVLVGDADRVVTPAAGRRLARAVPGAQLVVVPAAGHLLIHHHPEDVAAAVRRLAGS